MSFNHACRSNAASLISFASIAASSSPPPRQWRKSRGPLSLPSNNSPKRRALTWSLLAGGNARTKSHANTSPSSAPAKGFSLSARPRNERPLSVPSPRRTHAPVAAIPGCRNRPPMVNHYYFYGVDEDFGPFFIKFCSYFPCNAKLCLNGHEYVKRQLAKEGIVFEALDNGIRGCADPKRLQDRKSVV